MSFVFRTANKDDLNEMRFIAEVDSRIPLEYDSAYTFAESSIYSRLDYYKQLTSDDFFEVVLSENLVVGFHIVKKIPYPPNFHVGSIISLWVQPEHRGQGLAALMKSNAEKWARASGMIFMQTNVHKNNKRMLDINQSNGYEPTYLNLRKKL